MRKYFLSLVVLITFTKLTTAQGKAVISGMVADSADAAIKYVTITVFKAAPAGMPYRKIIGRENGKFEISVPDTGNYTIVCSHTNYEEKKLSVKIVSGMNNLPKVIMQRAAVSLKNVTVTATRPLIENTDDKIIYNVENDPLAKTENAIELLRKIPFVSVDGDDNIQVNGQNNFKVLLNGRETAMFAQNVKSALKGFPASIIVRVEVITNPSAKYDGEGLGGIINIITQKKIQGYNGSVLASYTTVKFHTVSSSFNAKWSKLGFSLSYNRSGRTNVIGTAYTETIPYVQSLYQSRNLFGRRVASNIWNNGNAELSWELDTLNIVSLYGSVSGGWNESDQEQETIITYPNNAMEQGIYNSFILAEFPTATIGIDWIKKFRNNKEREFSLRIGDQFGRNDNISNSFQSNPGNAERYLINNSEAKNTEYTLQADYIHPFAKNTKLETGAKAIFRKASSDFESLVKYSAADAYNPDPGNSDKFNYTQDVLSLYTTYSFKKNKANFRLGARLEYTNVFGDFISSSKKVRQDYINILPNMQVSTRFSNKYTLVTGYSVRIQRPFIASLNPFEDNTDSLNITFGNPDLDPQTIHNFSVQHRFQQKATFVGITLLGSYSGNMIVPYSTFDKTTFVTRTTSANLARDLQLAMTGSFNTRFNPDWTFSFNGTIRYNRVKNKVVAGQQNSGISGSAGMNTSYKISKKLNASAYGGFWRSPVTIQHTYPLNLWYGMGFGYKFLNDKLTLSIRASNFMRKDWEEKTTVRDAIFQSTTINTRPYRGIAFNLSWTFGKLKENVSKKKGINNDDLITTPTNNN